MKKFFILSLSVLAAFSPLVASAYEGSATLVRTKTNSAVYEIHEGKRYAFPDAKTYESWYGQSYSDVAVIDDVTMATYQLAGIVTYKPGSLIKIQTDPKVYEVIDKQGGMQWIKDEATAVSRFGSNWAKLVRDVPDSFFYQYHDMTVVSESQNPPVEQPTPASPKILFALSSGGSVRDYAVAYNNTDIAVVWRGRKDPSKHDELFFTKFDMSGKRVVEDLQLTNHDNMPEGLTVTGRPNLIWNGSEYAMAWVDNRNVSSENNLYFTRLNTVGVKLGAELVVDTASSFESNQHVGLVWNGKYYAVAWTKKAVHESSSSDEIFFARIQDDGSLVNFSDRITRDKFNSNNAVLTWSNSNYFAIAWNDAIYDANNDSTSNIYESSFMLLDGGGNRLIERLRLSELPASTDIGNIVWDGKEFAIWYSAKSESQPELNGVYMTKATIAGTIAMPMVKVTTAPGVYSHSFGAVSGSQYSLVWTLGQSIQTANISGTGQIADTVTTLSVGTSDDNASVIWDGLTRIMTWQGSSDTLMMSRR